MRVVRIVGPRGVIVDSSKGYGGVITCDNGESWGAIGSMKRSGFGCVGRWWVS